MGLSSSQARLLHLTGRMHQIEYKAQKLEAQKLQMANESRRVYEDYENALEATKIQYKTLNNDGSVGFVDATLAALENGVVSDYEGLTSGKTYLVQNAQTNEIYVTPEFAAQYGIQANGNVQQVGTLDEYLTANNAEKEEVKVTVPDYTNITGGSPVQNNIIASPTTSTTTYGVNGTFIPAVGQTTSDAPTYAVEQNNLSVVNVSAPGIRSIASYNYTVNPVTTRQLKSQTWTFTQDELNKTLGELNCLDDNSVNSTIKMIVNNSSENAIASTVTSKQTTLETTVTSSTKLSEVLQWAVNNNAGITFDASSGKLNYNNNYSNVYFSDNNTDNNTIDSASFSSFMVNHLSKEYGAVETLTIDSKLNDWFYSEKYDALHYLSIFPMTSENDYRYYGNISFDDLTIREYFDDLKSHNNYFDYSVNSDGSFVFNIDETYGWNMFGSYDPEEIPAGNIYKMGEITNAPSTTDIKEYFAYEMYNKNNTKTYEEYLTQLNSLTLNNYQWVSLYNNKSDAITAALIANNTTDINNNIDSTFDSAHYTLTQSANDLFKVKKKLITLIQQLLLRKMILSLLSLREWLKSTTLKQ